MDGLGGVAGLIRRAEAGPEPCRFRVSGLPNGCGSTGAACAAGTAETNSEMAIETTATAMARRIKRGMVSGSSSFSERVVMANKHSFRSEHW